MSMFVLSSREIALKCVMGFLAVAFMANAAGSTPLELESAILQSFPFDEKVPTLEQREKMVRAVLAYWVDFDQRVPRLSPTEDEWLKAELSTTGERLTRAINSNEYALWRLALHADACIESSNAILDSQLSPEKKDGEMFYWVKLINCYDDTESLVVYLQTAGLSNGKYDGPVSLSGSGLILNRIVNQVIPAAMAETMGWKLTFQEPAR